MQESPLNNTNNSLKSFLKKHRASVICCTIIICGIIALTVRGFTKAPALIARSRQAYNNSFLAQSDFFHVALDEAEMKADVKLGDTSSVIFPLTIKEEPDAKLKWACYDYLVGGFQCHLEDKHGGYNDFSNYYWDKHQDAIDGFLAKYPCLEEFGYAIISSCKGSELLDFSKELLTISDFDYLYKSYKAECGKLGEACEKGGKFIEFSNSSSQPWLFEWMKENGL